MLKSLILLCLLSFGAAAQKAVSPVLIDEFGRLACCDFGSHMDAFLVEMTNNPGEIGWVVSAGPKDDIAQVVILEEMVRSHVFYRNFDRGQLRFVRKPGDKIVIQFWRTRADSTIDLTGTNNTYVLDVAEPTKLLTYYPNSDGGLCPGVDHQEVFAWFLAANPKSRGTIVVPGYGHRQSKRFERDLSRNFKIENEIAASRLTFKHLRSEDGRGVGESIEYWYVP